MSHEIDIQIAETLFGWIAPPGYPGASLDGEMIVLERRDDPSSWRLCPRFSSTWEGAGLVVDELAAYAPISLRSTNEGLYVCEVGNSTSTAWSGPLAICRAALKAQPVQAEQRAPG